MPRTFTWDARLNTSQAAEAMRQLQAQAQGLFRGVNVELISPQSVRASEQAAKAAAQTVIEQQRRMTVEARAEAGERGQAARQEAAIVQQAARSAAGTRIEQERRSTAFLRAELRERERAIRQQEQRQQNASRVTAGNSGGGGSGIGSTISNAIAGYLSVQAIQQLTQQAAALAQIGTQANRTARAFEILSGGADQAAARLNAIKTASGGTVNTLQAVEIANQAISLGLAKTTGDFERLTRAARAVTFVSPVIRDVQSAIAELALASANTSYRRLDQLGLSVTEVKQRMAELQAANVGMEDSQAFLQASVDALIGKYGKLLDTTEAQASGVERLTVAWDDLYTSIGQGRIGQTFDQIASGMARSLNILTNNENAFANMSALNEVISKLDSSLHGTGLAAWLVQMGGTADQSEELLTRLRGLRDEVQIFSEAQTNALPGTAEYVDKLRDMLALMVNGKDNSAANAAEIEKTAQFLANLTTESSNYSEALRSLGGDTSKLTLAQRSALGGLIAIEQLFADGAISADTYKTAIKEAKAEIAAMATPTGTDISGGLFGQSYLDAQTQNRTTQREERGDARDGLLQQAQKGAQDLIAAGASYDQALLILNQKKADIDSFFASLPDGITGDELALRVAQFGASLKTSFDSIGVDLVASAIPVEQAVAQINTALSQLDSGAGDFVPGIEATRDALFGLASQIIENNFVTAEQAAQLSELTAMSDAAGGSASLYTGIVAGLGESFFATNEQGGNLLSQMLYVESAYQSGKLSAGQYAGQMYSLMSALYAVASAADASGASLRNIFAIMGQLKGMSGLPGFTAGQAVGGNMAGIIAAQEAQRQRETQRRNAEKAARDAQRAQEKAAREAEQAWNKAQRDSQQAAEAMQRAAESTAQEFATVLESIPGLFGTTKVTEQDMQDAKLGIYENKPDEYLRRLRDEVLNGTDYADVSIEEAAQGLAKIGVDTAGKSAEIVLRLFEQAYENSSLFADASNIESFVNTDAVQKQLDLKEKIKTGHQNLLDFFGATVESVNQAIADGKTTLSGGVKIKLPKASSGGGGGGTPATTIGSTTAPAAASSGGETIIDMGELTGDALDLTATVTGLELGTDVTLPEPLTLSAIVNMVTMAEDVTLPAPTLRATVGSIEASTGDLLYVPAVASIIDLETPPATTATVNAIAQIIGVTVDPSLPADPILISVTGVVTQTGVSTALLPANTIVSARAIISETDVASSISQFPEKTIVSAKAIIMSAALSDTFQPVSVPVKPDLSATGAPAGGLLATVVGNAGGPSLAAQWAQGVAAMFAQEDVTATLQGIGRNARANIDAGAGEGVGDVGWAFVFDMNESFGNDLVIRGMQEIGRRKIEDVYTGWKNRAKELDWAGVIPQVAMSQIVDTAAAQATESVTSGLTNALANTYPASNSVGNNKRR